MEEAALIPAKRLSSSDVNRRSLQVNIVANMRQPLTQLLNVAEAALLNGVDCVLQYHPDHVAEIPVGVDHGQHYRVSVVRYLTGEPPQRQLDRIFLGGAGWGHVIDNFQP
ncbi:hypothetical protein M5689_022700 [Euphorbia peplus]|nr:hypothetical protein M5689_022700 [Euphorbia peplus]